MWLHWYAVADVIIMSLTCQYIMQAHVLEDAAEEAFIMEDRRSQKYVAMAESVGRSLTAMIADEVSTKEKWYE